MTIFWYPHLRIFRPRRLEVLLLVDSLQVGNLRLNFIPDRNIVKGEFNFGNRLGFQAQIDDLPLKCCILGQKPKNLTSGRSPCFLGEASPLPNCEKYTYSSSPRFVVKLKRKVHEGAELSLACPPDAFFNLQESFARQGIGPGEVVKSS